MSSLVGGGSPSLSGSKYRFLLSFLTLAYRSIETGYTPHLLRIPLQRQSIRETNHWSSIGGAWCNWLLACYLLLHMSCSPLSEKSRSILHSHIASWNAWLGRTTVKLRWTTSACKHCMPVNHTVMQGTTKQQTGTLPGCMLYNMRGICDVMLPYMFDFMWEYASSVYRTMYCCHTKYTHENKFVCFRPLSGGGG